MRAVGDHVGDRLGDDVVLIRRLEEVDDVVDDDVAAVREAQAADVVGEALGADERGGEEDLRARAPRRGRSPSSPCLRRCRGGRPGPGTVTVSAGRSPVAIDCSLKSSLSDSTPIFTPVPSALKNLRARSAPWAALPSEVTAPTLLTGPATAAARPAVGAVRTRRSWMRCAAATCWGPRRGAETSSRTANSARAVVASRAGRIASRDASPASVSMLATGSQARMLRWAADEWTTVPPIASTCARSATSPLMLTSARPIGLTSHQALGSALQGSCWTRARSTSRSDRS